MKSYFLRLILPACPLFLMLNHAVPAAVGHDIIDSLNALPHETIVSDPRLYADIYENNCKDAIAIQYPYGEAKSLERLGMVYYLIGQYDRSADCYLQAIRYFEKEGSSKNLVNLYGEFGYQLKRRNLNKAILFMQQAISIAEAHDFKRELAGLYDNYGVLQEMASHLDSAQFFYQRALDLKTAFHDTIGIPYSLNKLAGIQSMQGCFDDALALMKQSDSFRCRETGKFGRIENQVYYAEIFTRMGDIDSAIVRFRNALNMTNTLTPSYTVRYCYEQLSSLYEQQKNYRQAFLNQQKYIAYKDSALNLRTNTKIAELEINYETEKKDRVLAENQLAIRKKSEQQRILIAVLIGFVIVSVWFCQQQRAKTHLKQLEMQNRLADEKIRISRELHDNIGSQLTFIISSLDNLGYQQKKGPISEKIHALGEFGRNTLHELRNTIWAMKHEGADLQTLILKLNEMKQQIHSHFDAVHLQIENHVAKPVSLNTTQMLNLYRIVQEAVQNALKHGGAKKILVTFYGIHTEGFEMRIQDDGEGFNVSVSQTGNGLKHMKSRCEESGGVFELDSSSNGTEIFCHIHLENRADDVLNH